MRVLIPDDIIGDDLLVSSTITDDLSGVSDWAAGTTYTAGDEVQYRHTSYTAKTIEEGMTNVGQTPGPVSDYWTEGEPSNKWAMFDSYVSTQTTGAVDDDIVVVMESSRVDSLCLLGCEHVESVRIQQTFVSSGETVLDETLSMIREGSGTHLSWSDYFFGITEYRAQLFTEFDAWTNSRLTLTIYPASGYAAKVGHCLIGQATRIGTAQWGVSPSLTDYSQVSRDETTGRTKLLQGNHAKNLDVPIWIENTDLDRVSRVLAAARAVPAVWDCNEGGTSWESVTTLGFIREFAVTIPSATQSNCNLTVEGLI
jgi:hypothetical protein